MLGQVLKEARPDCLDLTGATTSIDRNFSSVYGLAHDDSENPRDDVLRMSLYVLRTRVLWHREASNSALEAEN
jgi:hypothetical protein